MPTHKIPRFTELLPATPCTPEMRQQMVDAAGEEGESLAAIQRSAFTFFLAENNRKAIGKNSNAELTENEVMLHEQV